MQNVIQRNLSFRMFTYQKNSVDKTFEICSSLKRKHAKVLPVVNSVFQRQELQQHSEGSERTAEWQAQEGRPGLGPAIYCLQAQGLQAYHSALRHQPGPCLSGRPESFSRPETSLLPTSCDLLLMIRFHALCISEPDSHVLLGVYSPLGYQMLSNCTSNCGQYYKEKVQNAMRKVQSNQIGMGEVREGIYV